jgi:hypothetical protein
MDAINLLLHHECVDYSGNSIVPYVCFLPKTEYFMYNITRFERDHRNREAVWLI